MKTFAERVRSHLHSRYVVSGQHVRGQAVSWLLQQMRERKQFAGSDDAFEKLLWQNGFAVIPARTANKNRPCRAVIETLRPENVTAVEPS